MKEYVLEIKKLIPESFCKKIIAYFDKDLGEARIVGGKDKLIRNCNTKSVMHTATLGEKICSNYIQQKVLDCKDFYASKFKYLNVSKISSCDILKYEHNEYKAGYTFHTDMGISVSERQISVSICLNNDFEGGEFVFDFKDEKYQFPQNVGDAVVFPSNFMFPHQVNQVTQGTRYAIVAWLI
tara:strand:+ start:1543 stop:2088 length:546 start_codon:yes stop_codon:yes gene_type:complete